MTDIDVTAADRSLKNAIKRLTVQEDEVGDASQLEINCNKGLAHVQAALVATAQQAAEIAELRAASRACRAWHYAENGSYGSFSQRTDLCSYSEFLTQKALGLTELENYKPVPVIFGGGTSPETIDKWIDDLLELELAELAREGEG